MGLKWRGEDLFPARCSTDEDARLHVPNTLKFLHPSLCPSCKGMYFDFTNSQPDATTDFEVHELVGRYQELERRASTGCVLCSFVRSALLLEAKQSKSSVEWPLAQDTPVSISYAFPLRRNLLSQAESLWLPLVLVLKSNEDTVHTVDVTFQTHKSMYRLIDRSITMKLSANLSKCRM
jgi:hypothetical protein